MANGGNINYNIRFNTDTSGLNRSMQELQKIRESLRAVETINIQFANVNKTPEEIKKITKELTEAQNAAKTVGSALQKSFNSKLKTVNVTSFNNELKKSGTSITEIGQKLSKAGLEGQRAFRNIAAQIAKSKVEVKQANKLLDEMKNTIMSSIKWGITSSIWNNMSGSIEKAWGFAKKLDSSLNNIRIVTEKSAQDMEKFATQANKAAKNLGSSTAGYTEASLIYYQQGLSETDIQARTETTLKAANVTGQSTSEVSEQLTAVWNGYKVSAQEAELYIDKLSAVAASTAADLEELSTGMSKVASAANVMGIDIDQLSSQLATVVSATRQAPESVGTAFKTIYARMGDIEAGIDTEASLGEYTKKMSEMGFNVLDTNGKLKDMGLVIEEIGNKWTGLSREQQIALSRTMAGTRQYNNLLALFDNWDEYTKSLETSRNAAGSLQKQQETYMESMEAHLQKLATEGERVYNNLFDANTVNPLIDALTALVSLVADFVDGMGGIGPILSSLGSIFTSVFSKQIASSVATTASNVRNAKKNAIELQEGIKTLREAGKGTTDEATKQISSMGQSIKDLALKGLVTQDQVDQLQTYIDKLADLAKLQGEIEQQQKAYQEGLNLASEKMEQSGVGEADANREEFAKIGQAAKKDKTDYSKIEEAELEENLRNNNAAYGELSKKLDEQRETLKEATEEAEKYADALAKAAQEGNAFTGDGRKTTAADKTLKSKTKKLLGEIKKGDFSKTLLERDDIAKAVKEYEASLAEHHGKIKPKVREKAEELSRVYLTAFEEMSENIGEVQETARDAALGQGSQIEKDLAAVAEAEKAAVEGYSEEINDIDFEKHIAAITDLVGGLGQLANAGQMIINIFSILGEDSLSFEEKMKQIIPLLIAAIPMILMGINTIGAALPGAISGMAALMVSAKLLTAAEVEAAVAAGGLGTAIWTALLPILPIVLAVVAAVGLLIAAGVALHNAYNADAIAAEKAAEAAKEAASAAEKAKTAYEELANTIKGYDDAVNSLKELTQGTQEYTEALEEANAKAIELISANAKLANHVARNSEGLLVFDESVKEDVLETARKQANQAQAASYLAQTQAGMAQNKSDVTDLGRSVSFYDYDRGMTATAESVMPSVIKAIQEKGSGLTKTEIAEIPGVDDRLIPAIQDHMAEIVKQTKATGTLNQTNNVLKDEILRASLENSKNYANRSEAKKNVIVTVYGEGIELSEDSEEYQKLVQEAETKYKDPWGDDSAMQKEYAQKMRYTHISDGTGEGVYMDAEGNEQKVSDEIARTWLKQQHIAEQLANYNETGLENISDMVDSTAVATKDFSQSTQDEILGVLAGDKEFDTSNLTKEDFDKLQEKSTNELKEMFKDVDFSSLGENGADIFIQNLQEGLNNLDWSNYHSSLISTTTSALENINNALKDFKLGEQLDDEVISELEKNFPELKRIWDKTSKEYYDALRKAQEETEEKLSAGYGRQGSYEYGETEDKQTDYEEALDKFKEIGGKSQEERFDEAYAKAYDEVASTAGDYIDAAEKVGYGDNTAEYGRSEAGKASAEYIKYEDAKKYAAELEAINIALEEGNELTEEQSNLIDKDYSEALKNAADAADNLKTEVEEAFKADYELEISITNDLLSDIDEVVARAENARTAVEMIGEGFKVSAENSEELLTIFPELAHNAQVLADGTIQLDDEVTKKALGNDALEIGSKTEVAAVAIDNRIAELEADKAAMEAKLEDLHKVSVATFDIQSFLGENYQEFKEEEVNANALAAQDEVTNSAASAKAVIANWYSKIQAAEVYAKVAAAAEAKGHDTSGVMDKDLQTFVDQTVASAETTNSVDMTEEEKKKKEEELKQLNQKLYDLTEDYLKNKIDSDEKQIAELLQSKSKLYAKMSEVVTSATAEEIDLLKDVIDIYHDINILLDDMAKKIDRVNKAQEHLVGADWLAAQKQGLKLLEEEIELRRKKQGIQQKEAIALQGHLLADGVKFFDDGSVANYESIMLKQIQKVNDAKMSGDEDAAEAAEKNYEAFKANFERYEKLRDEIEDLADEVTDMMYDQISKKVETFTAKLTVKLDTAQAKKEWKKFTNQLTISANDALAQITAQSSLLKSDRSIASKTTSKYGKIVNEGMKAQALVEGTAEKGTKSAYATYSKELGKYIFNQAKWQEDMSAAQKEAQESILQIIDGVDSLGSTAIGLLEDTIAAQKEQLATYDDMNSLLNHAMKLQELFVGEDDYDSKVKMYEEQALVSAEKTRAAKDRRQSALDNVDGYAKAYEKAKQKYEKAVAAGSGDVAVLEKQLEVTEQAYESMKNELKESTEDFYSSIEEQIEIAKNAYINTINKAMADMEKKMTGGKGLSYISDEWDLINKNAERYLDTVNSTYETQSLEAKYRKAIDSTGSLNAQKKLNKAMEDELKALQEKDKLSQYDIDRANKKYEITMKQIALEEAQANKSSMRLRRDAQGNYSYQFVADENAIADTQQDLLAAQNDLYNFDKERYQQTLDDALAAYQEYQEKMLEAAQINDPEKRAEMEKLITEQYQEYLLAITADNETAKQNLQFSTMEALQGMYSVNSENFDTMTKGMFEDFKDANGNIKLDFQNLTETELPSLMGGLVTGWDGSVQSMIDKIADPGPDGFKEQSKLVFKTAQEAAEILDATLTTLGNNFSGDGNTADKILDDVTEINDKMKDFKETVLDPTVEKGKEKLPDAWAAYKTGVDKAAKAIKTLYERLEKVYVNADNLAKKLQDIASQSPINVDINYKTTGDATSPSGNYSSGGGGGSGGIDAGGGANSPEQEKESNVLIWKGSVTPRTAVDRNGRASGEFLSQALLKKANLVSEYNTIKSSSDQAAFMRARFPKWKILNSTQINSYDHVLQIQEEKTGITGYIPDHPLKINEKSGVRSFDTGGYTGEWGSDGRMAMLHEKEIVLNKQDTENILSAVSIVRGIGDLVNSLSANLLGSLSQKSIDSTLGMRDFEQNVHITAEFPNVSSSSEVEDALRNLTNVAAQRAFNTRV